MGKLCALSASGRGWEGKQGVRAGLKGENAGLGGGENILKNVLTGGGVGVSSLQLSE